MTEKRKKGRHPGKKGGIKSAVKILLAAVLLTGLTLFACLAGRYMEWKEYRLDYPGEILEYAHAFSLDPYLVAAVIHCESGNRSDAISPKGAVGLMQIMPDTGAWIAEKLGMDAYSPDMLTDPAVNIRMGCWYLGYLLERFGGALPHALAAYNAGQGNVDKWLADGAYSQEGVLVKIPFPETENYVKKVERAYEKYKELYQGQLD